MPSPSPSPSQPQSQPQLQPSSQSLYGQGEPQPVSTWCRRLPGPLAAHALLAGGRHAADGIVASAYGALLIEIDGTLALSLLQELPTMRQAIVYHDEIASADGLGTAVANHPTRAPVSTHGVTAAGLAAGSHRPMSAMPRTHPESPHRRASSAGPNPLRQMPLVVPFTPAQEAQHTALGSRTSWHRARGAARARIALMDPAGVRKSDPLRPWTSIIAGAIPDEQDTAGRPLLGRL